jgi:hypothetical protein
VQYRLADSSMLASCASEHVRFVDELQRKLHDGVVVQTTVLTKVVDDSGKHAESGCAIM